VPRVDRFLETPDHLREVKMKRPGSLHITLGWSLMVSACSQSGDAGGGAQAEPEAASSSSSGTGVDPTTTMPTVTGETSPAPTDTTTSTTTSGAPDDDSSSTAADNDTGGSSSSSTADGPSGTCGDGELDGAEECDHGADNDDDAACTLKCKLATCGDQLIWEGQEDCDNGPNNNDNLYAGCTTQCTFGPMCNDGIVQGPEECDLASNNGSGEFPVDGVPCDNGCRFQARLAFLSSMAYKGGELGGVEGAHIKCQLLAEQSGYDNASKFMAWLSDSQHSPDQDFTHIPETGNVPYVRPDGVRIADGWADLTLNGPLEGIIVTNTGEKLLNAPVWTGTAPSGKPFDPNATCDAWSSSDALKKSRIGVSGVDKLGPDWTQWAEERWWTNYASLKCSNAYQIYCFEQ
jgi:hypothetical protein